MRDIKRKKLHITKGRSRLKEKGQHPASESEPKYGTGKWGKDGGMFED